MSKLVSHSAAVRSPGWRFRKDVAARSLGSQPVQQQEDNADGAGLPERGEMIQVETTNKFIN